MITQKELKKIFDYNPETGDLIWRSGRGGRVKAGNVAGYTEPGRYTRINLKGKLYYAHRLIFLFMAGHWPQHDIDHINGIKSDNRWINLRDATRSQNLVNKKYKNKSGHRGVVWASDRKRYRAVFLNKGKSIHLGQFKTAAEAGAVYNDFAKKVHGEFFCGKTEK